MISRPRPRLILDIVLAASVLGFAIAIGWEIARVRPLPPPPRPATRAATAATPSAPGIVEKPSRVPSAAETIAARNLFSASRSEVPVVAAAPPQGPKPVLHGVLLAGQRSRAYLEDPVAKRIFGFAVGDTIGGGLLEQIAGDRVIIRRPDGPVEVMLQDPAKPRQPAAQPPSPKPAPAPTAAAQPPADRPQQ